MARQTQDKEDLIAEARALVTRVELKIANEGSLPGTSSSTHSWSDPMMTSQTEPIVLGQRTNGWFSVFFGQDPAYHFDEQGALRRAFVDGDLFRSGGNTLIRSTRDRTNPQESVLRSTELANSDWQTFRAKVTQRLEQLITAIDSGAAHVLREVAPCESPLAVLRVALQRTVPVRLSPLVGRR